MENRLLDGCLFYSSTKRTVLPVMQSHRNVAQEKPSTACAGNRRRYLNLPLLLNSYARMHCQSRKNMSALEADHAYLHTAHIATRSIPGTLQAMQTVALHTCTTMLLEAIQTLHARNMRPVLNSTGLIAAEPCVECHVHTFMFQINAEGFGLPLTRTS